MDRHNDSFDIMIMYGQSMKGQKTRDVYLPESIRSVSYPEYPRVRRSKPGVNALFTNMCGEPLTYDDMRMHIYQVIKEAEVHFSPHMAKRFYARYLYQQGYDLEVIRLIFGDEKLDTTKRYMQIDQKDALDLFSEKQLDFFSS